jgi:outer membrane protein assembly factor BamB
MAPKEWLGGLPANSGAAPTNFDDWRMLGGTPSRTGLQTGSPPFLMREWTVSYSSSYSLRQRMEWMIQELADNNRPIVMAAQPLAIDGKAIYRDLRGVHVIDLETGKGIWDSIEGLSAERIARGMIAENEAEEPPSIQVFNDLSDPFGGQQAESHPLINLMLRDAAYNTLSSDGRQVFFIEDQGILSRQHPGYQWGWDSDQSDQHGFSWTSNRLSSYDLQTGRPLWTVGGPETTESFQLPLAGVYFHGAPTPDGDDLFVLGSKGDELRLWCLDRRTGGLHWSQLVGYSDAKIEQDLMRRWMVASPSVSEGIVVCPTTIGWLVAVDRLRQSVLWAARYSQPTQGMDYSMGSTLAQYRELGGQWGAGAPVILGQRVVYAPPEDDQLVCVDLLTGMSRWQVPREDGQYLAGVTADRAIVVGMDQVWAIGIADGKKLWTHPLGDGAKPAGRAALTADQLYLPLSTGELRVLQIAEGKPALRTFVPDGEFPLGNLVLHRGRMVSFGPQGLTGFRQQAALWAEIQQRKAQNPSDPAALLSEAEIHLLNHEPDQALPLLRQAASQQAPNDLMPRLHRDLMSGLSAVIRDNLAMSEEALAEMERTAKTPEERLLHLDLSAERFLTLGRHEQAFDLYWKLASEPTDGLVRRTDDAKVAVQRSAWLAGRLKDVWSSAKGEARQRIDGRIADALATSSQQDDASRQRLANLVGFHPSAKMLTRQLIEARVSAGQSAAAEIDLLRLAESGDPESAAWAEWKLGELMERFHFAADAAWHDRRLETDFGAVVLPDGRTGAQIVAEIRQAKRLDLEPRRRPPTWDERPLLVSQLPYVYNQPAQEITTESRLPFFDSVTLEYLPREQRLAFLPRQPGGFRWLAPLRASVSNRHNGSLSAEMVGHCVAAVHQDVLHLLDPLSKETVWSLPLDGLSDGLLPYAQFVRRSPSPMWSVQQSEGYGGPLYQQAQEKQGRLAVVETGYIAVYGRRAIHVLDSRTGAEMWRKTSLPPETIAIGGPDILWLVSPNRQQAQGYRVSDGAPIPADRVDKLLSKTIGLAGNDLVVAESGGGMKILLLDRSKTVLRRCNPLTNADVWKEEFKTGALLSRLSDDELIVLPSSGEAELVATATGKRRPLEALTPKDLQSHAECFALADEDQVFVVVNAQSGGGYQHFAESLPSVRVHGTIFAWQRSTGKLLWKQTVHNQHLIVDRFRASPVLVFCSREWKQRGNVNFSQLSLVVLHKQTGKRLHESSTPTMYNGFHSLAILPEEQAIELRSYNLRMKLFPADQSTSKGSD